MGRRPLGTGLLALSALLVPLLGGCLEAEETLVLEADGGGRWRLRTGVDPAAARLVEAVFAETLRAGARDRRLRPGGFDLLLDPERTRRRLEDLDGVALRRLDAREEAASGRRLQDAEVAFEDLGALERAGLLRGGETTLGRREDGAWVLERRPLAAAARPEDRALLVATLRSLRPRLEDFAWTVILEVPGEILETNGEREGERGARWRVEFEDLLAPETCRQVVVFADEGQDLVPYARPPRRGGAVDRQPGTVPEREREGR